MVENGTAHTNCALLVNITVDERSCPGILLYSSYLELFLNFLRALKSVMDFLVSQVQEWVKTVQRTSRDKQMQRGLLTPYCFLRESSPSERDCKVSNLEKECCNAAQGAGRWLRWYNEDLRLIPTIDFKKPDTCVVVIPVLGRCRQVGLRVGSDNKQKPQC